MLSVLTKVWLSKGNAKLNECRLLRHDLHSASSCVDHMKYLSLDLWLHFSESVNILWHLDKVVWGRGAEGFFLLLVTFFPDESVCMYILKIRLWA